MTVLLMLTPTPAPAVAEDGTPGKMIAALLVVLLLTAALGLGRRKQ